MMIYRHLAQLEEDVLERACTVLSEKFSKEKENQS